MKNKVETIIEKYNDIELAFFAKYRLQTYMPETQKKITELLKKRNLNNRKANKIVEKVEFRKGFKAEENQCPRCFSKKVFVIEEEVFNNSMTPIIDPDNYRTDIEKTDVIICQVCGFNITYGKKPTVLGRLIKRIKEKIIN